jgi:hypothetical protein
MANLVAWEITEDVDVQHKSDSEGRKDIRFLTEGDHYHICPSHNGFKTYRKVNDFAMINVKNAKALGSNGNISAIEKTIKFRDLSDIGLTSKLRKLKKIPYEAVEREALNEVLGSGKVYISGFTSVKVDPIPWKDQRSLLTEYKHVLFNRRHIVVESKPRSTWASDDLDSGKWSVPMLWREYVKVDPQNFPSLKGVMQSLSVLFMSEGGKPSWQKIPVVKRDQVKVNEHLMLAQGCNGDPWMLDRKIRKDLVDGPLCGGTWNVVTEKKEKDEEDAKHEVHILGMHVGGPSGLEDTYGGLYIGRFFDRTMKEEVKNLRDPKLRSLKSLKASKSQKDSKSSKTLKSSKASKNSKASEASKA